MGTGRIARAVKLVGTTVPESKSRRLAAGPLSAELDNGQLRYIRIGGVEVLRAIAFLVRDENWGTFTPALSGLKIHQGRGGFEVAYAALCGDAKRKIAYRATIGGRPDGTLVFECTATPRNDFPTNRTGFVVLHPLKNVAGCPVEIERVDGRIARSLFPRLVNPVQPFHDIRSLAHEVAPGLWATCRMDGDTFEMEDHRNWSDASYKTYVRPLALPWPYTLKAGLSFTQKVTLSFKGPLPKPAKAKAPAPVRVAIGEATGPAMPQIGFGVPAAEAQEALGAIEPVRALGLKWLVCQVDLRRRHGLAELKAYRRLMEETGAAPVLEVILPGRRPPAEELRPLVKAVDAAKLPLAAIAISPAADLKAVLPGSKGAKVPPLSEIYAAARAAFPGVALGGGSFAFFTELNRKRPPAGLDYVTHTTCPIVHAADDVSVMETLEALPFEIETARSFLGGAAYRVGPSAIGCRDNPYGAAASPNPGNGRVCLAEMDPRWRGLFGAAWTLGYVAAFARGGLNAIAIGAPTGPHGLIYRKTGYRQPGFDGSRGPLVYPVFHVMAGLARASGRKLLATTTSDASAVTALAFRGVSGPVLWLANLTAAPRIVDLAGFAGPGVLRVLDEASFMAATRDPSWLRGPGKRLAKAARIKLGPYAVAQLTSG